MGKMGWLHHLVQIAHTNEEEKKELEEYLADCNFKNPKLAAREFLTAYAELEENAAKVDITAKKEKTMIEVLIKIAGSLFIGGMGLLLILICTLVMVVLGRELITIIKEKHHGI